MTHYNILHIEDQPNFQLLVETILESSGLDYTLDAVDNRQDALRRFDKVAAQQADPYDVVLLDANLESGRTDGRDGRAIMTHMRELGLTAHVIGVSAEHMADYRIPVDYDLGKTNIVSVVEAIEELGQEESA